MQLSLQSQGPSTALSLVKSTAPSPTPTPVRSRLRKSAEPFFPRNPGCVFIQQINPLSVIKEEHQVQLAHQLLCKRQATLFSNSFCRINFNALSLLSLIYSELSPHVKDIRIVGSSVYRGVGPLTDLDIQIITDSSIPIEQFKNRVLVAFRSLGVPLFQKLNFLENNQKEKIGTHFSLNQIDINVFREDKPFRSFVALRDGLYISILEDIKSLASHSLFYHISLGPAPLGTEPPAFRFSSPPQVQMQLSSLEEREFLKAHCVVPHPEMVTNPIYMLTRLLTKTGQSLDLEPGLISICVAQTAQELISHSVNSQAVFERHVNQLLEHYPITPTMEIRDQIPLFQLQLVTLINLDMFFKHFSALPEPALIQIHLFLEHTIKLIWPEFLSRFNATQASVIPIESTVTLDSIHALLQSNPALCGDAHLMDSVLQSPADQVIRFLDALKVVISNLTLPRDRTLNDMMHSLKLRCRIMSEQSDDSVSNLQLIQDFGRVPYSDYPSNTAMGVDLIRMIFSQKGLYPLPDFIRILQALSRLISTVTPPQPEWIQAWESAVHQNQDISLAPHLSRLTMTILMQSRDDNPRPQFKQKMISHVLSLGIPSSIEYATEYATPILQEIESQLIASSQNLSAILELEDQFLFVLKSFKPLPESIPAPVISILSRLVSLKPISERTALLLKLLKIQSPSFCMVVSSIFILDPTDCQTLFEHPERYPDVFPSNMVINPARFVSFFATIFAQPWIPEAHIKSIFALYTPPTSLVISQIMPDIIIEMLKSNEDIPKVSRILKQYKASFTESDAEKIIRHVLLVDPKFESAIADRLIDECPHRALYRLLHRDQRGPISLSVYSKIFSKIPNPVPESIQSTIVDSSVMLADKLLAKDFSNKMGCDFLTQILPFIPVPELFRITNAISEKLLSKNSLSDEESRLVCTCFNIASKAFLESTPDITLIACESEANRQFSIMVQYMDQLVKKSRPSIAYSNLLARFINPILSQLKLKDPSLITNLLIAVLHPDRIDSFVCISSYLPLEVPLVCRPDQWERMKDKISTTIEDCIQRPEKKYQNALMTVCNHMPKLVFGTESFLDLFLKHIIRFENAYCTRLRSQIRFNASRPEELIPCPEDRVSMLPQNLSRIFVNQSDLLIASILKLITSSHPSPEICTMVLNTLPHIASALIASNNNDKASPAFNFRRKATGVLCFFLGENFPEQLIFYYTKIFDGINDLGFINSQSIETHVRLLKVAMDEHRFFHPSSPEGSCLALVNRLIQSIEATCHSSSPFYFSDGSIAQPEQGNSIIHIVPPPGPHKTVLHQDLVSLFGELWRHLFSIDAFSQNDHLKLAIYTQINQVLERHAINPLSMLSSAMAFFIQNDSESFDTVFNGSLEALSFYLRQLHMNPGTQAFLQFSEAFKSFFVLSVNGSLHIGISAFSNVLSNIQKLSTQYPFLQPIFHDLLKEHYSFLQERVNDSSQNRTALFFLKEFLKAISVAV